MTIAVFPLQFSYLRILGEPQPQQLDGVPFLIGAMMTPGYAHHGERLLRSCRDFSLPVVIYEVPTVHCSISPKGTEDLSYTKANFIRFLLDRYKKPVLYIDVDCVVVQYPDRIGSLLKDHVDFAVFNWLAEEDTAAYRPVEVTVQEEAGPRVVRDRFFRFSHSIDFHSQSQLICSGAVQFHNNTPAAKQLLASWHEVIEGSPHGPDDGCLDFAFNNRAAAVPSIKAAWLDKRYCRIAWWICTRPIIDHPDFPPTEDQPTQMEESDGKRRVYFSDTYQRAVPPVFPPECIIDTKEKVLLRVQGERIVPVASFSHELWL